MRSFEYLALSVVPTLALVLAAWWLVPLRIDALTLSAVWVLYAVVTGTWAVGCWVIAHECGHRAFSRHAWVESTVGFLMHSALLVPYYTWRGSHAAHHARTNHLTRGESHVPVTRQSRTGSRLARMRMRFGRTLFAAGRAGVWLLVGFPSYLLFGATGTQRQRRRRAGVSWSRRLLADRRTAVSLAGVGAMIGLLVSLGFALGAVPVLLLYGGPYLVVNAWVVLYTRLHHTDVRLPHLDDEQWEPLRATFLTVDRRYPRFIDLLHHRIGTTHVAHHVDPRIPHYHAAEATEAIRAAYPDLYRYDPTPIPKALWRAAADCLAVAEEPDGWYYRST